MLEQPHCPLCGEMHWQTVGSRRYQRAGADRCSPYTQKRLAVLFQAWFPENAEVQIEALLCQLCGLVIYGPRPEEADLAAKYQLLASFDSEDPKPAADDASELARSQDLFDRLRSHLPDDRGDARVLDFGGGDGRLMRAFRDAGLSCDLLDYEDAPVAGVERAGATLADLPNSARYDLIVCSHVFEHLAEPRSTLERLAGHLRPGGVIYVEVPMEIWRRAPLGEEPVTHINFFTVDSARFLLAASGLEVLSCKLGGYRHPGGHDDLVVRAFGRPSTATIDATPPGPGEAMRYLQPGLFEKARRAVLIPSTIPAAAKAAFRRMAGRTAGHLRIGS